MRFALLALYLGGCDLVFQLDEGSTAALCSRGDVIADDFEGTELAPVWRVLPTVVNNRLSIGDGQASLELGQNVTAAAFEAVPFFEFRGSTFQVDVTTSGDFGPTADSFVQFDLQAPNFVWFVDPQRVEGDALALRLDRDEMQAGRYDGGNFITLGTKTVTATPLVWRIANEGGDVVWSFSEDGTTFTELNRLPLDIGLVRPRMLAFQGNSGPFEAHFDRFNGGGVATGEVCPTSVLREGFDAPLDPDVWSETGSTTCHLEPIDGELTMQLDTEVGPTTLCFVGTGTIYDLYQGGIAVQLSAAPVGVHFVRLIIETASETAEFTILEEAVLQLYASGSVSGANYAQKDYDAMGAHRFLRFSAERDAIGEQLVFEASADGKTYELLGKTPDFAGLDRVRFRIQVDGDQSPAGTLAIQGVNAP